MKVPSVVALLAYWAIALPLGYGLGFGWGLGAPGIWLGLLTGLSLVAGVLLLRFRRESQPGNPPAKASSPAQALIKAEELLVLGQPAG
ncbi:hypothetical protein [Hymenobacter sp. BRD67]|uniref:hypothetical protein n=1 Tax=Hymenobacter sp. BRD67 TaxID=2675877 RepID=UPI0020B78E9C|nr:hypothetical protein [Hymenobacter sp. BRD67]